MLQRGVEILQSQVSCFSIGSILIKPVQRILKYPLILNELVKVKEFASVNGIILDREMFLQVDSNCIILNSSAQKMPIVIV